MSHTLGNWCVGSSLSAMVVANGKENRTRKLDLSSRDGKVARGISQAEIVSRGLVWSSWWMGVCRLMLRRSSQQQVICHEQKRPRHGNASIRDVGNFRCPNGLTTCSGMGVPRLWPISYLKWKFSRSVDRRACLRNVPSSFAGDCAGDRLAAVKPTWDDNCYLLCWSPRSGRRCHSASAGHSGGWHSGHCIATKRIHPSTSSAVGSG